MQPIHEILWSQFGATIDMLENAIRACPEDLWGDPSRRPEWVSRDVVGFWYVAFHTLFFLDFPLSDPNSTFAPPPPFTLDELDPAGLLPDRIYTKTELLDYLDHCRRKCRASIAELTEDKAREPRKLGSKAEGTFVELLLYVMRHVQHHTGQLNLMLRRATDSAPRWVAKASD